MARHALRGASAPSRRSARRLRATRGASAVAIGFLIATLATPLRAQDSGSGFLFQRPAGSVTLRAGYTHPNASGGLFSFVTDQLTLSRGDFSGLTAGADLALRVAPQLDVVFSGSYAGTNTGSEFRRLVDQDNLPIQQTTTFQRVPVTASLRLYLTPPGRSIGQFAWVPARFAPYVGAGGGAVWYRFRQQGDFVDYRTNGVFTSDFTSSDWAPAAVGMAGFDYSLTPRLALTGEAQYLWAKGNVSQTFTGFDRIDLSGPAATLGLSVRF